MPVFVPDGPEVPERLLQAHEEGRVVFFCGAGISYPAGLPGFRDLVSRVYAEIGESCDEVERTAFSLHRYDETFDLLERRLKDRAEDRLLVRRAVARILEPNLRLKGAKDTHKALLDLSRDERGVTRLVTTNFDRVFERVNRQHKWNLGSFLAPLLPIPKPTKWDGIVYLHGGLLSKAPTATELNRIVLSSGDFGLAYLSERWASRFVSELLKNFTVCFVGYSIEDPVLRYMMDALAADELLGEDRIESFAFASYKDCERDSTERRWRAKNVEPILFDETAGGARFAVLHQTVQEWARVYTTGIQGKRMIVSEHASSPPKSPARADYVTGRMLWSLTDPRAARYFAEFDPVPPLGWLESFDEFLFNATDLERFGVRERQDNYDNREFSMLRRPSPSNLSPWMELVSDGNRWSNWDQVMWHLARWLVRHLGNPNLILWITSRGGRLHPGFWRLIENRLSELGKLEVAGAVAELDKIREKEPKGVPGAAMRKLWQLVLADRIKGPRDLEFHDWFSRLAVDNLTIGLRSELRELLKPCVKLEKHYPGTSQGAGGKGEESVDALMRWEIVPATDRIGATIRDNQSVANWKPNLPLLLDDFITLLKEAMALSDHLSCTEGRQAFSVLHLPSIEDHAQNRGFHEWTVYVSLVRDAWLATLDVNPSRARETARGWWGEGSPLLKRMALFAATKDGTVGDAEAVDWLLSDGEEWLWNITTRREVLRLLVALGQRWQLTKGVRRPPAQALLESAILAGPTIVGLGKNATAEDIATFIERAIWLRLAKLASGSCTLGRSAAAKLKKLSKAHPEWMIAENQRDEFAVWMETGFGPRDQIPTPTSVGDLIEWLEQNPRQDTFCDDQWRDRCRTHFRSVVVALLRSHRDNKWYPERLNAALQAWSDDENLQKRSWCYLSAFLSGLSDDKKVEILSGLAWWLQAGSKVFEGNESRFYSLADVLVRLSEDDSEPEDRDLMFHAINHPIGHTSQAVLNRWFKSSKKGEESLDGDVRAIFTKICDPQMIKLRSGRVILAGDTGWLHQVDAEWTKKHLIPLFDWDNWREDARACWTGFLYSPRRIPDLLKLLKGPFITTASHLDGLGNECRRAYAHFFTFVALEPAGVFTDEELRSVLASFGIDELDDAARTLSDVMEGAGSKAEALWREAVRLFIEKLWPKSAAQRSGQIAGHFAEICIYAGSEFSDAVESLRPFFQPLDWSEYLIVKIKERDIHRRFPKHALDLIYRVVGESPRWPPPGLQEILSQIEESEPKLKQLISFKKLKGLFE